MDGGGTHGKEEAGDSVNGVDYVAIPVSLERGLVGKETVAKGEGDKREDKVEQKRLEVTHLAPNGGERKGDEE